jgi:S-DNA-T family DNA segregation ATPase FtsK/SpoIIIE
MRPANTPELIERAKQFALEKPSTSYIQRKLMIGYNQAAELMEHFEAEGIVSAPNSAGVRVVLTNGDHK